MTELCNFVLNLNVDCVEFSPFGSVIACGLYQLIENERKGGVVLLKFDENRLKFENFYESSGVFHLKYLQNSSKLITATADGHLNLLDSKFSRLSKTAHTILTDKMLLSADLRFSSGDLHKFVASDSDGHLHTGVVESQAFEKLDSWRAHQLPDSQASCEVWCSSFSHWNSEILFSGADDCKWKLWDTRDLHAAKISNGYHKAGVISVCCHPTKENYLLTGSYDDFLCLWDLRTVKNPLLDINLGGGVWKIKFRPKDPSKILCACMYNGWALLNDDDLSIKQTVNIDGSLLYGVDWSPDSDNFFVCCTFYDRTVRIFQT